MKIKDIRVSVHSVPVKIPLIEARVDDYGHGGGRQTFVFCEVETDDGHIGYGVTAPRLGHAVKTAIETALFPLLKDMDPWRSEAIHERIRWRLNQRASTGVVSGALSCIDIALWDIKGKSTGRTVAELMGGHKSEIAAYVTFGMAMYDRDQLVEAARLQVEAGFTALKMVVNTAHGDWREDVRRVRAVREAVGDEIDLMIDANMTLSPVEAKRLCHALEEFNLAFFEEPLHQNDAQSLAELKTATRIPLAAGQNEGNRWRHRDLVLSRAVDLLQPSCLDCGGFTEQLKIAHMAQAFNLPVANGGGWPLFNMHAFAGLSNGTIVEWHLGTVLVCETIFEGTPRPVRGRIAIPATPGLGLAPNRDALREYTIKP
jgi:L-alanine-DL-glutamate epimerase-like enolase superfamily enzyme